MSPDVCTAGELLRHNANLSARCVAEADSWDPRKRPQGRQEVEQSNMRQRAPGPPRTKIQNVSPAVNLEPRRPTCQPPSNRAPAKTGNGAANFEEMALQGDQGFDHDDEKTSGCSCLMM